MPTIKPRINVTLQPQTHAAVQRLAALSGDSMSSIIAGFVDLVVPSLERVVVALERARDAPEEVRAGLLAAVDRAERELVPRLQDAMSAGEAFQSDVERAVGGGTARDAQRRASARRTRRARTPA